MSAGVRRPGVSGTVRRESDGSETPGHIRQFREHRLGAATRLAFIPAWGSMRSNRIMVVPFRSGARRPLSKHWLAEIGTMAPSASRSRAKEIATAQVISGFAASRKPDLCLKSSKRK